ncbi:TPA: S-ribosylhomocysteine lyase, partial [Vibrio cholerae]
AKNVIAAGISVNRNDELALPESMLNELKVH